MTAETAFAVFVYQKPKNFRQIWYIAIMGANDPAPEKFDSK